MTKRQSMLAKFSVLDLSKELLKQILALFDFSIGNVVTTQMSQLGQQESQSHMLSILVRNFAAVCMLGSLQVTARHISLRFRVSSSRTRQPSPSSLVPVAIARAP